MEKQPLTVLILEDSEFDAVVLESLLRKGGYAPEILRVETLDDFAAAVSDESRQWDIILADYNLPGFQAPAALAALQESGKDIPFIIISGGIGEDTAVEAMKAGAHDYLMKGQLTRLVPAVEREIRESRNRQSARKAEEALRRSERLSRLILENSKDAIILTDFDSVIQLANPAVEKVFGYDRDSIVGKNISILLPDKIPDDIDISEYGPITHNSRIAFDQPAHETLGQRRDRSIIVIEISFNRFDIGGKPYFAAFIRDISARKRAEKELRSHEEQFRVAREIQQRLFPKSPPTIEGMDIAGASIPALISGGDYYDYLQMPGGCWGFVVADVTGHGVGPAMLTAETRAYLRLLARESTSPAEILNQANKVLADDLDYERYITAILVAYNPATRSIIWVNAGHPPAFVFDSGGSVRTALEPNGSPLGIRPETPYRDSGPVTLNSTDGLMLYSDGIEEARNESGDFFSRDRLELWLRHSSALSADDSLNGLLQAASLFRQGLPQADDMTAIIVKGQSPANAGGNQDSTDEEAP